MRSSGSARWVYGKDSTNPQAKITLDQYLSYLRHGLNTCYYCVVPTAFPEELQRKCVGHQRAKPEPVSAEIVGEPEAERERGDEEAREDKPAEGEDEARDVGERRDSATAAPQATNKKYTFPTKSNDEVWVDKLDLRVRALVEDVDVVDYCGRDIEDETKRLTAPCIKQEEADKYRCKQCSKLFRAPEFVIKHIVIKHGEVVKDKLDDVSQLFPRSLLTSPARRLQRVRARPAAHPAVCADARGG
jgi:hypothetical protein